MQRDRVPKERVPGRADLSIRVLYTKASYFKKRMVKG